MLGFDPAMSFFLVPGPPQSDDLALGEDLAILRVLSAADLQHAPAFKV